MENWQNACDAVVCQNGGVCVNDTCACINGFTGIRCDIPPPINYPTFFYLVNSTYESWKMYVVDGDSTWYTYNDTLIVQVINQSTVHSNFAGYDQYLDTIHSNSQVRSYYRKMGNYNHYTVSFYTSDPDSVSGVFYFGGRFYGTYRTVSGRRIH